MDFNIFDAIVISITIILAIKGYFSGIIKEISGLIGIAAGLFFASTYYMQAGEYINSSIFKISNQSAINVVGFVSVFVIVWVMAIILGLLFSKILQVAKLGILDRIGGIIFSAGKFFLIVSVIVTMLSQIEAIKPTLQKYQKDSIMWPIMDKVGTTLIHIKPEEVTKKIDTLKQKVNTQISENITKKVEQTKEKIVTEINKTKQKIDQIKKDINNTEENLTKGE